MENKIFKMQDIKEFLVSIGLGKNEAEIYSDLVEKGTSSVLEISKRTKLHRSNIYDDLRSLVQRGFVFEVNGPTTLFVARQPHSLINYIKEKEMQLDKLVKEYESRANKKNEEIKIKVSKGLFAFREALFGLLENGKRICVYGIPKEAAEKIGPILNDFHRERIKRKILIQQIYNSGAVERVKYLNKMKYTEAKLLPSKYDSFATTNICGNKIFIFWWGGEMSILEIMDKNIAQPYQNYFEILWRKAKAVV